MQFFGTQRPHRDRDSVQRAAGPACRIFVDDGSDLFGAGIQTESLPVCDQYTIQGDAFSKAVRGEGDVPVPVEDAIRNMAVIDALFRSAESGRWEIP